MIKKNQINHIKAERNVLANAENPWIVELKYSFQVNNNKHYYSILYLKNIFLFYFY